GVDEALFQAKLEGWGEKIVALVSLLGVAWAAYARVFKPTPPLTEKAAQATQAMAQEQERRRQGGYIRAGMLALILALTAILTALPGCAQLGLQTSGTFNDRLAGGYSAVTAVAEGAGVLLDARVRAAQAEPDPDRRSAMLAAAKADAQNLKDQAQRAKDALDIARSLRGVNFEAAEERLV